MYTFMGITEYAHLYGWYLEWGFSLYVTMPCTLTEYGKCLTKDSTKV
jgi:hypothetical protein